MIDVLNDIEILEKSLDLDDFGRQLLIWEMIQKKKKEVVDFEAEQAPKEFEESFSKIYKHKETA